MGEIAFLYYLTDLPGISRVRWRWPNGDATELIAIGIGCLRPVPLRHAQAE